jgi:hypothetical protein
MVRVIPELYRPMLDTILSRWPATRHIQFALAGALFRLGVGANGTTILSVATGLIAGLAFARGATIVGVLLLGTSALLDAVDGTIAREFAAATPLGGILDLCSDRVVEIAVILGISWRRPELYFPALILTGSWYLKYYSVPSHRRSARAPRSEAHRLPARTGGTHRADSLLCGPGTVDAVRSLALSRVHGVGTHHRRATFSLRPPYALGGKG